MLTAALNSCLALLLPLLAPVPKKLASDSYKPTDIGTTWVYNSENGNPRNNVTQAITRVENVVNGKLITIDLVQPITRAVDVLLISDGAIYSVQRGDHKLTPAACLLVSNPKVGSKWDSSYTKDNREYRAVYQITEETEIDVPAGKFKTLRVDCTTWGGEKSPRKVTLWYARGVGPVKVVDGGNNVPTVLMAFKSGKLIDKNK